MKRLVAVTCLVAFAIVSFRPLPCAAQQQKDGASAGPAAQSKPIPIAVQVEAEGEGKGQGMWTQAAIDLTPTEAKTLETLVVEDLKKQDGLKIVPRDYQDDYIGVVVVAAKLPNGGTAGSWYYIASSVITLAKKKGTDELVTHDVVAGPDLSSLAHSISYLFSVVRFRAAFGLWK